MNEPQAIPLVACGSSISRLFRAERGLGPHSVELSVGLMFRLPPSAPWRKPEEEPEHVPAAHKGEDDVTSKRRVAAAGLVLGLALGTAGTVPASASVGLPILGGLLGGGDGGVLGGLIGGLLHGEGGVFGHEGGVLAGDDQLGEVIAGFDAEEDEFVGGGVEMVEAVQDVVSDANIGGEGSFGGGSGALGGVLGGLLSNGVGLLGGVL